MAKKTHSSHISAMLRKKTATVHAGGQSKFPIPDKKHARLALQFENRAKPPLTPSQRAAVEAKAHRVLGD